MRRFLIGCAGTAISRYLRARRRLSFTTRFIRRRFTPRRSLRPRCITSRCTPRPLRQSTTVAQTSVAQFGGVGSFHHHHHHQNQFFYGFPSTVLFYPGIGYSSVWSSYYTPLFPAYYPTPTYFISVNNNLPEPQREARVVESQSGSRAAGQARAEGEHARIEARAGKMIALGDGHFGKKKYASAIERATAWPPRPPTTWPSRFSAPASRSGAGTICASGQIVSQGAGDSIRLGMGRRSGSTSFTRTCRWPKKSHLEDLAKAVEANPWDANLLLVLGIELYFDGQQERASLFFSRASRLGANNDHLFDEFLPQPGPAGRRKSGAAKIVF